MRLLPAAPGVVFTPAPCGLGGPVGSAPSGQHPGGFLPLALAPVPCPPLLQSVLGALWGWVVSLHPGCTSPALGFAAFSLQRRLLAPAPLLRPAQLQSVGAGCPHGQAPPVPSPAPSAAGHVRVMSPWSSTGDIRDPAGRLKGGGPAAGSLGVWGRMENPVLVSVPPQRCLASRTSRYPVEAAPRPPTLTRGRVGARSPASACPAPPPAAPLPAEPHPWVLGLPGWSSPSCPTQERAPGRPQGGLGTSFLAAPESLSHAPRHLYCCARNHSSGKHRESGDRPLCWDKPPPPPPQTPPGEGSPGPAGLGPAGRGESDAWERSWGGSLRWGGSHKALGLGGSSLIEHPEPERVRPSPVLLQSLGRTPPRPSHLWTFEGHPQKVLGWQRDALVAGKLLPTP